VIAMGCARRRGIDRRRSSADSRLSDLESGERRRSSSDKPLSDLESGEHRRSTLDSRLPDLESTDRRRSSVDSLLSDLEYSARPRAPACARWVVALCGLLACARAPTSSPPTNDEAAPTEAAQPDASRSPTENQSTDPWCELEVFALEEMPPASTLQSRLPSTPMLALATRSLSSSDCSSVGWHHLAFAPTKEDASGLVGAYLKRHLPVVDRVPDAPYYLVGAKPEAEHAVDLKDVCIDFRGRTNATPLWVVAIADDTELAQWKTRITNGLCGRT
jgi:hypothetical protein